MAGSSTGRQARRGVAWLSGSQIARQATQLLTVAILARVLIPADFGLMSMALVVVGLMALLREMGLGAAVIRSDQPTAAFLSTLFWANAAVSMAVAFAMIAVSPWAAEWFGEPRLEPVLIGLAPVFVLSGLGVVHQSILERGFRFGYVALAELLSYGVGAAVAIVAALMGAGVWSLVAQAVAQAFVLTGLLVLLAAWLPGLTFHGRELLRVAGFSLSIMGFNAANFVSRNADYALIGRYLGPSDLGYYTLAYRLMLYPLQVVATVFGRVMYPIYSRLQDQDPELRRQYVRAVGVIGFLAFPIGLGMMAIPERVVTVLFGTAWAPAAGPLALLAPVAVVQVIVTTVGPIYLAKGRTNLLFAWGMITAVVTVSGFVIGLKYGIEGVAGSYLVTTLLLMYPALAIPYRLVGLKVRTVAATLARPLLCAVAMFVIVRVISLGISADAGDVAAFVCLVALGGVTYGLCSVLVNRDQLARLLAIRTAM